MSGYFIHETRRQVEFCYEPQLDMAKFQGDAQSNASPSCESSQYTPRYTMLAPTDVTHGIDITALSLESQRGAEAHKVRDTSSVHGSYNYKSISYLLFGKGIELERERGNVRASHCRSAIPSTSRAQHSGSLSRPEQRVARLVSLVEAGTATVIKALKRAVVMMVGKYMVRRRGISSLVQCLWRSGM